MSSNVFIWFTAKKNCAQKRELKLVHFFFLSYFLKNIQKKEQNENVTKKADKAGGKL